MIDIFKLFHVEDKEDIYTYCLKAMLEYGGSDFKKRVGEQFGFEEDFLVSRKAFSLSGKGNKRQRIIPDLVLYNSNHISIIESKMFSVEGYLQTVDYVKGAKEIKGELGQESASVAFFFLTLSGINAESQNFKPVKWTDFYEAILKEIVFDDEALEIIRKTILSQVDKYRKFEKALVSRPYSELFNKDNYWVTPLTLFSSGVYDNIWQTISGEEEFLVWNGEINGRGHSEFTTNLNKNSWFKSNEKYEIDINLFIRIEWRVNPIIWLCWEYRNDKDYIPTNRIEPPELKKQAIESLIMYKEIWKSTESCTQFGIHTTDKKASSIKALKCEISGDQEISKVIEEIKRIVIYYSIEIRRVINAFDVKECNLKFIKDKYNEMLY